MSLFPLSITDVKLLFSVTELMSDAIEGSESCLVIGGLPLSNITAAPCFVGDSYVGVALVVSWALVSQSSIQHSLQSTHSQSHLVRRHFVLDAMANEGELNVDSIISRLLEGKLSIDIIVINFYKFESNHFKSKIRRLPWLCIMVS